LGDRALKLVIAASIALSSCPLACQAHEAPDEQKINIVIGRLVAHENPQDLLDPMISGDVRREQLRYFANGYEITLVPEGPVQFSGQTATVPARLTFKASSATSHEEMEESTHLAFVDRDGRWYFANYDFLKTTPGEILVVVGLMILAGTWVAGTLLKWRSLRRQRRGPFNISDPVSDYFQAVNPFTWFREES
jgi:hypothetical protein